MKETGIYTLSDPGLFKQKALAWAGNFPRLSYLDSNNYYDNNHSRVNYHSFDCIIGADSIAETIVNKNNGFESLKDLYETCKDWLFGFLTYDLKNEIENLVSENSDNIEMPALHFFRPKYVFIITGNKVTIEFIPEFSDHENTSTLFDEIKNTPVNITDNTINAIIKARFSKNEYLDAVNRVKEHIQRGDIYELNLCQEFYCDNTDLDPYILFNRLKNVSPTPFSCLYRIDDKFLLSASPERFIKKTGAKVISQPIKGTIKRGKTYNEDVCLKEQLISDPKEQSENVMIVDLVRNDLSRTAKRSSVMVEELLGVYGFKQVYQIISTIVSEIDEKYHFTDVIKNAFPMGSMTGAPKIKAMELIEKYEKTRRGLYSGSVGYITPEGDFDFNVVIRSILYNASSKYMSFITGGAITSLSDPEKEYEECLVKAEAMIEALNNLPIRYLPAGRQDLQI